MASPFLDKAEHIYVLDNRVGAGSYHLSLEKDCYIDYKNAGPNWRTDDGKKFPLKKNFLNPYFDLKERTFTGTILWEAAPLSGNVRWDYVMVFSKDWKTIVAGNMITTSF